MFSGQNERKETKFRRNLCSLSLKNGFISLSSPHAKDNSTSKERFSFNSKSNNNSFVGKKELEIVFVYRKRRHALREGVAVFEGDLIVHGKVVKKWKSIVHEKMPMVAKCRGFCSPYVCLVGKMEEGVSSDFLFDICDAGNM